MKKTLAILLAVLMVCSLAACGGKTLENEPSEPVSTVSTGDVAGEKKVTFQAGWIHPPVVEYNEELKCPNVEIVSTKEQAAVYRTEYDESIQATFRALLDYPNSADAVLPQLLFYHETSVKAFALCEDADFFEDNILILIGIQKTNNTNDINVIGCTHSENTPLQIDVVCYVDPIISFSQEKSVGYVTVAVAVSKTLGIDSAEDIVVNCDYTAKS